MAAARNSVSYEEDFLELFHRLAELVVISN